MKILWDQVGDRRYETGVDHGVLYLPDEDGVFNTGFAWNGLTGVTESPSGAEPTAQYADNMKYLNLISAEEFAATVEALTYPDEFALCNGEVELEEGLYAGQQGRSIFGLAYRTKIGDDVRGPNAGYKLHLVYNALAGPSEKAYTTVNDSPEALAFSWELSTTPVEVPGVDANGKPFLPTASLTIDSTKVDAEALEALEVILYGKDAVTGGSATPAVAPRLPLPAEVRTLLAA